MPRFTCACSLVHGSAENGRRDSILIRLGVCELPKPAYVGDIDPTGVGRGPHRWAPSNESNFVFLRVDPNRRFEGRHTLALTRARLKTPALPHGVIKPNPRQLVLRRLVTLLSRHDAVDFRSSAYTFARPIQIVQGLR